MGRPRKNPLPENHKPTFQEHKDIGNALISATPKDKPVNKTHLQKLFSEAYYMYQDYPEEKATVLKLAEFARWAAYRSYKYENDDICNIYYAILLWEAQELRNLDAYFVYLERKREFNEMFYAPKREQLMKIGLIQALQDMIDDKCDILTISLPPGTGKSQPLYSKVLTPDGFVKMGDLSVGSKVIAGNGNITNVIGIYPQGKQKVYEITLRDGMKCRCSDNHLWTVWQEGIGIKTVALKYIMENGWRTFLIPVYKYELEKNPIASIEYIGEEECQCIMIDDPCHLYITDDYIITHNTTLSKFFISAVIGWFPNDFNLFFSHSGDIARMYYDGVYDIVSNSDEYCWHEIFPDLKVTSTNAKMQQFNIGKYKPFPSLQCTSRGSNNAGVVRASKFLMVDDLIAGIEEAMNKNQLDKLWNIYAVDARQRKIDGAKEIHIATRWSVHDVIGRIQRQYENDPRCRFISIPDIDHETGKSNFNYRVNGFSEEFFHDQEKIMDDVSYRCLYKNEPIEREGLLYHVEDLRRYATLPVGEPDAILSVCDTKSKGVDYFVMPVMYKYGSDYYMVDCLCNKDCSYDVQYEKIINLMVIHNVQMLEIEANMGGDRVAHEVSERLKKVDHRCNITTKYTESNKETRIIVNAEWIKSHVLFRQAEDYGRKSEYGEFMSQLLSYSVEGKNLHDDVCDAMANFVLFVTREINVGKVVAVKNPFWR